VVLAPVCIALRQPHTLVVMTFVILGVLAAMKTPVEISPTERTAG
jgi:hypothetical protein